MMPVEVCGWTKASGRSPIPCKCVAHMHVHAHVRSPRGPAAPSWMREAIVSLMSTYAALVHQDVAARLSHASLPLSCVSAAPIARLIGRRALRSRPRMCSRT